MKKLLRRLGLGIIAIVLGASLAGCQRAPQVYSMAYNMPVKQHHQLLHELNRQGVGVIEVGQTLRLILPTDSFFRGTSTSVKEWRKYTLYLIGSLVNSYPNAPVHVTGNTDNVYTLHDRKEHSIFTAKAIASYLWNHGTNINRIKIAGKGDQDSIASNQTPKGAAYNRRVVVYIGLVHPW
jgi:intracellular multiplication protein IcmN